MLDKLNKLNKKIDAWTIKKQGGLTKGQHLILMLVCFFFLGIASGYRGEGEESTFFNYFLPFACAILIGGFFSLNAIVKKKYKKKKDLK